MIKSFPVLVVGEFVCGISFELSVSVVLSVVEGGSVEEGGGVPIVVGLVGGSVVGRGTVYNIIHDKEGTLGLLLTYFSIDVYNA